MDRGEYASGRVKQLVRLKVAAAFNQKEEIANLAIRPKVKRKPKGVRFFLFLLQMLFVRTIPARFVADLPKADHIVLPPSRPAASRCPPDICI